MLIEKLFPQTFFACFALRLVFSCLCEANERKRYITLNRTHRLLKLEVLYIRTLQFFLYAICVCRLFCRAIKKKAPCYYKKDIIHVNGGVFFSNIFACVALRFVCSLLFKANERKVPYYSKDDSSFALICAWCV